MTGLPCIFSLTVKASQKRAARETHFPPFFVSQAERRHEKRAWSRPGKSPVWPGHVFSSRGSGFPGNEGREPPGRFLSAIPAPGKRRSRRLGERQPRGRRREGRGEDSGERGGGERGIGKPRRPEPHGAQVALSRSGELLPRLPLAAARGAGRGHAARSSSGSRAARHFR